MFQNRDFANVNYYQRYTKDLLRDPFYMKLEKSENWLKIYLASMAYLLLDRLCDWLADERIGDGWCAVRVQPVGVGSVCPYGAHVAYHLECQFLSHISGAIRNYETDDNSRNNLLGGFLEQWRRLAQQSPCRPARGGSRPQMVGVRCHLDHYPRLGDDWAWLTDVVRPKVWTKVEA